MLIRPFDFCFRVVFCLLLMTCSSSTFSQSTSEFESGPFQSVAEGMSQLVRLEVIDRKLAIRKDWAQNQSEEDHQDQIDREVKKLKARGFNEATAVNLAERIVRATKDENPFSRVFFEMTSNQRNSVQKTSRAGKRIVSFQNPSLAGRGEIENRKNDVELFFVERQGPKRELRISHLSNGAFTFRYSGEEFSIELEQQRDARITLQRTIKGKTTKYSAADFLDLHRQDPQLINQWLFPLMSHVGISTPIMTDDRETIRAVFNKLMSYSQRQGEFDRLVEQLNSEQYELRNLASNKIINGGSGWLAQIEKKLENENLPLETRVRLQSAMRELDNGSPVDQAIRDQGLLDSPAFLIGILDQANEDQLAAVIRRLKEITGARLERPEQWVQWLKQQKLRPNRATQQDP